MGIEETYKGMWSSDPELLKSLLDAGETIIAKDPERKLVRLFVEDEEYLVASENEISNTKMGFRGDTFLVPPRPLVLKPKPLRWCMWDAFSSNLKSRDEWRTSAGLLASGRIRYTVESRDGKHYWRIFDAGDHRGHAHGYCDTQEEAIKKIEKWREDHLEMPVFKCESETTVDPKP